MRLACLTCDRIDADGVDTPPPGWVDVGDPLWRTTQTDSVWWTHLGTCPECHRIGPKRRRAQIIAEAKKAFQEGMDLLDSLLIE